MLRRLGYRRILPLVNVVLFAALMLYGDLSVMRTARLFHDIASTQPATSEGPWEPVSIDRPTPLPQVFAAALNFPAMLFALPFGFFATGWRSELVVQAVAAAYVVLLWYAVGKWLDRTALAGAQPKSSRFLKFTRRATLILCAFIVVALLSVFVVSLKHYPHAWPEIILSVPALFWPAFLGYVARWELRNAAVPEAIVVEAH